MLTQGSLYVQEWKNGVAEYVDFSDIHITCKYGWKSMDNGTTQVGTLTDVSLAEWSTHDFITIPGDSHTVEASWDDEQHMMESPVLYDIVFTVNNQKINKMSWNPTNNGWTTIGDCATVDTGINNGYQVEFLNSQRDINVETQTDTKAWSTTEPYFGTGVIADGAYSNGNIYLIADGTNHPGELSINETATWNSSDILKYSKQTSGIMFYTWDPANVTQCSSLNHYTWDVSNVYLGYDNTTALVIGGVTYTKQNPGPSYYELKCGFNYGGSVRPAKTMIRWGTNEPYSEIIYGGLNPEYFSWQEQSVPSGEVGTLVVEFVDSNNNGLTVDSYSSQDYVFDTDTTGSYGGTRLLIKSPDNSNIYDYSAGNFIECDITLADAPQPSYSVTIVTSGQGTVDGIHSGDYTGQYYLTAIPDQGWVFDHWTISGWDTQDNPLDTSFPDAHQTVYVYFVQEGPQPTTYDITTDITGDGTVSGINNPYASGDTATVTATANSGSHFVCFNIVENVSIGNPKIFYVVENTNLKVYFSEDSDPLSGNGHWETNIGGTVYSMTFNGTTNEAALFTDSYGYYYVYDNGTIKTILKSTGEINTMSYNSLNNTITYFGYDFTWVSDGPQPTTYTVTVNVTGQGTTTGAGGYEEGDQVTLTAAPSTGYEFSSWQINGTVVETNSTYQFIMGNQDVTITAVFEEEAEKHIYLCDNSGAHLAEMTKTGSTWSVTGAFTSGMYSIRATVENEYEDAWFKFYQTSGDNRIFVGAGDDPEFTDIGTYIMIDDILTSFSLEEDQTTGYYVVSYENTGAMTVSMVDTIVNSYIGDFVTGSDIAAMSYITMTDVQNLGYIDQTTLDSMSYITMTDIEACGYIDQATLSNMSYITMTDIQSLGYLTQSDISDMSYITMTDVESCGYIDQTALSNMSYITMTDVQGLGYMTQTDISSMGYMTATDISAMGYMTQTDISSMSYITMTDVQGLGYIDQATLSSMSYVDNSYLGSYMNAVVGDINSILQTI